LLVGLLVAALVVRAMINGGFSFTAGLAGLLVVLVWLVFWWRVARTGIFVSRSHVTVRLAISRTVPLRSVGIVSATPRSGARQLTIHTDGGRHVTTSVRGSAAQNDPGKDRPGVLPAAEFDRVLADLRRRATTVRSAPPKEQKEPKRRQARSTTKTPEPPEDPAGELPPGMLHRKP
jgi:hypothetical protein